MAVTVCDVEFGCWVCGESWLAIKDSLTHRPSSQGWAPSVLLSCHVMCNLCMCFVWIFWGLWIYVGGFYLFISLSIYLSTYGWYAMNYNFMRRKNVVECAHAKNNVEKLKKHQLRRAEKTLLS